MKKVELAMSIHVIPYVMPYEMVHYEPPHLDLYCLPFVVYHLGMVKLKETVFEILKTYILLFAFNCFKG